MKVISKVITWVLQPSPLKKISSRDLQKEGA
jgi:hypothetical protein